MKLKLIRTEYTDTYTMGDLYVNDEFFCNTIEDRYRNLETEAKVPGETAIPLGTYKVIVNMSPRFGRELPRLLDVPHFEGVLIHRGNYADYTKYLKDLTPDIANKLPYRFKVV